MLHSIGLGLGVAELNLCTKENTLSLAMAHNTRRIGVKVVMPNPVILDRVRVRVRVRVRARVRVL